MNLFNSGKRKLMVGIAAMVASISVQAQTLVYCSEATPESFNPQLVTSGTGNDASSIPIYNRLVEFKLGTTEVGPGIAESWDVSDDGKIYTFYLRKGVSFHSNRNFKPTRDLNADDVIFSFMRQHDENHPYHSISPQPYIYYQSTGFATLVNKIEKVDGHTVRFVLNQPEGAFLANMAMGFASILSAEYGDLLLDKKMPERMDLDPIGTGPFEFRQYQQDSRILYTAFKDHFGEKAKLDRLIFSITPDPAVRQAKLQKGECHVMAYPNLADLDRLREDSNIKIEELTGLNIGYIAYNMKKKPLDNLKVRKALTMAVNKADIIEAIFHGAAEPAKNFIPPTMWSYNDDIEDYPYDPEAAKALLKEAGLEKGFTVDLWAMPVQRPYNPNARRMAEMVQADWKAIGVDIRVVSYEWGEYLSRIRKGEHETVMMGWTGDNGDPDNFFGVLMSCAAAEAGSNYANWCDPKFDAILNEARQASNHERRIDLYRQAQVMMHENVPALMIAHSMAYMPMRKEVKGYVMDPLGAHNFNQVELEK